jgi:Zn-dependent protease with chaperone function
VDPSKQQLKTFPGLDPNDLRHPDDIKATKRLTAVPGFELLYRKVVEFGFERAYYLANTASNVRVGHGMFPRLQRYAEWAGRVLDMEVPEIYVSLNPQPTSFTFGQSRPFVVINSGLLDVLDERERFFLVAHELGHIKCEHTLYTMMVTMAPVVVNMLGAATLGLGALVGAGFMMALYNWSRKAALSADRAGMIAVQDRDVPMRMFMKLAGGAKDAHAQMDHMEFLRQIRAFEEIQDSNLEKAYNLLITFFRDKPFPIMRAKVLDQWIEEGGYQTLTGLVPNEPFASLGEG